MHVSVKFQPPVTQSATCSCCDLRELCLPKGLDKHDSGELDSLISLRRRVVRGQRLYRTDDSFNALYAIRSGSFKTDTQLDDARIQVTGFHMAGDVLGMDGIGSGNHISTVVALEDSEVCVVPFPQLEQLSRRVRALQHRLHELMSREIVRTNGVMMMLGKKGAEERLADFLTNLSQRFSTRGYPPNDFHLRMSRAEIGSYLGLRLETVSRYFSRFREQGLIAVRRKHVRILDNERLRSLIAHQSAIEARFAERKANQARR